MSQNCFALLVLLVCAGLSLSSKQQVEVTVDFYSPEDDPTSIALLVTVTPLANRLLAMYFVNKYDPLKKMEDLVVGALRLGQKQKEEELRNFKVLSTSILDPAVTMKDMMLKLSAEISLIKKVIALYPEAAKKINHEELCCCDDFFSRLPPCVAAVVAFVI
jgi:hypothetical protein